MITKKLHLIVAFSFISQIILSAEETKDNSTSNKKSFDSVIEGLNKQFIVDLIMTKQYPKRVIHEGLKALSLNPKKMYARQLEEYLQNKEYLQSQTYLENKELTNAKKELTTTDLLKPEYTEVLCHAGITIDEQLEQYIIKNTTNIFLQECSTIRQADKNINEITNPIFQYINSYRPWGWYKGAIDEKKILARSNIIIDGNISLLQLLIDLGADLEVTDENKRPLLHRSAGSLYSRATEITELLVQKGANTNAQDTDGKTPLHYACCNNYANRVKLLIDNGATKINAQDKYHSTPLHIACKWGLIEVPQLLITYGAKITDKERNRVNKEGWKDLKNLLKQADNKQSVMKELNAMRELKEQAAKELEDRLNNFRNRKAIIHILDHNTRSLLQQQSNLSDLQSNPEEID